MHQKKKLKEPYMQLWEHFIISKFRSKSQLKYLIVSSSPLHYTVVKYVVHSVISAIPTGISYTSLTTTLLSKHQSNQYWCCVYVYVKLLLMFGQDALAILLLKLSWAIKPLLNWTELNWKRFTMPIHNEWISQGMLVWQSNTIHWSLIQINTEKCPTKHLTWPNKSMYHEKRSNCHWQIIWRKKYCRYITEASVLPTLQKKHLSPQKTFTHQVFVLKKKILRRSALPTETSVKFPPENSLCPP